MSLSLHQLHAEAPLTPHATPTHDGWPAPGYGTVMSPNDYDYSDPSISNRIAWLQLELVYLQQRIRWLEKEIRPFLCEEQVTQQSFCSPSDTVKIEGSSQDLGSFIEEFVNEEYRE